MHVLSEWTLSSAHRITHSLIHALTPARYDCHWDHQSLSHADPLTYSLTLPLTHSCIHCLTDSTHSRTFSVWVQYSPNYSLTHSLTYSPTHSLRIASLTYILTHSIIYFPSDSLTPNADGDMHLYLGTQIRERACFIMTFRKIKKYYHIREISYLKGVRSLYHDSHV